MAKCDGVAKALVPCSVVCGWIGLGHNRRKALVRYLSSHSFSKPTVSLQPFLSMLSPLSMPSASFVCSQSYWSERSSLMFIRNILLPTILLLYSIETQSHRLNSLGAEKGRVWFFLVIHCPVARAHLSSQERNVARAPVLDISRCTPFYSASPQAPTISFNCLHWRILFWIFALSLSPGSTSALREPIR